MLDYGAGQRLVVIILTSQMEIDPQLLLFRRQYFQLVDPEFLAWPPKELLRLADAQQWLYRNLLDQNRIARMPRERYQLRVLKPLLARIEKAIIDPEEDVSALLL